MDRRRQAVARGREAHWIEIGQVNAGAGVAESLRHGTANALRGARQQHDTSIQPNIHW